MNRQENIRILCVSDLRPGYPMQQRYNAMMELGYAVKGIDYADFSRVGSLKVYLNKFSYWLFRHGIQSFDLIDVTNANSRILNEVESSPYDIIWLDKALAVKQRTLQRVKEIQPDCKIVGFSHDDMAQRHNQSKSFLEHLPCYDMFITTKSYNVDELKKKGCKHCRFVDNSFDTSTHRPNSMKSPTSEQNRYEVGFIGCWEKQREELFKELVHHGITIHVWGGRWHKCSFRHPNLVLNQKDILGDSYAETLCSMDIALCLLRKINRDVQTTRSIEIPACETFMLAERTAEHQALFEEGKEADFFSSTNELITKIQYYLSNPEIRTRIAKAGRERCLRSGYSNQHRIRQLVDDILKCD